MVLSAFLVIRILILMPLIDDLGYDQGVIVQVGLWEAGADLSCRAFSDIYRYHKAKRLDFCHVRMA